MKYDADECETALDALFHDMSNVERQSNWLRVWWASRPEVLIHLDLYICCAHPRCHCVQLQVQGHLPRDTAAGARLHLASLWSLSKRPRCMLCCPHRWASVTRRRVNMGTADELALDVLINMLSNFSRE